MRGPNIWSAEHCKLIVLKTEFKDIGTSEIKSLCDQLGKFIPSINEQLESILKDRDEGKRHHGFAKILALLTLKLQQPDKEELSYYNTNELNESIYAIAEYEDEELASKAAETAASIINSCLSGEWNEPFEESYENAKKRYTRNAEGPTTNEILKAAQKRDIPITKVAEGRYSLLGYGKYRKRLEASIGNDTARIGIDIAGNKHLTKQLFKEAQLPVPDGVVVYDGEDLEEAIDRLDFPLVVKPHNGHHGRYVTTNICDKESLLQAFNLAKQYSPKVIVEKFISGNDYRFLVINYKVVAAALRSPALVVGDGHSTIHELIEKVNADPLRANGHKGVLTKIEVDEDTTKILTRQNLNLDSVLENGFVLNLKDTANLSTGGTATDVTDEIHPDNIVFAERAARVVGLDICGLDIIAPEVKTPFIENGASIIEVNAAPGLRMHFSPSKGTPRNVGKAIIDMMFPDSKDGRIPIVAVTGTNGKTTTTRLVAHIAQANGYNTGFTTTEGIYINNTQVAKGDCSGPKSSKVILQDPSVDMAVLECARGGILRSGLAFDKCDVGIVTNVASDHLGLKDICTIEDMARVKQVVPLAVKKDGYAILNACDKLVVKMGQSVSSKVGLFSIDPDNARFEEHCSNNGIGATKDHDDNVIIRDGQKIIHVENVKNIHITMNGMADFMTENVLAAVLAAYSLKIPVESIRKGLTTFYPNEKQAPGRLTTIDFENCKVMVDYAHNPHGLEAFAKLMSKINAYKVGIITAVGDRRDQDIISVGKLVAAIYDELIIRIDEDTRGRDPEEIIQLLRQGITEVDPAIKYHIIPDMKEAVHYAISNAKAESYIVVSADHAEKAIKIVKEVKGELSTSNKTVRSQNT